MKHCNKCGSFSEPTTTAVLLSKIEHYQKFVFVNYFQSETVVMANSKVTTGVTKVCTERLSRFLNENFFKNNAWEVRSEGWKYCKFEQLVEQADGTLLLKVWDTELRTQPASQVYIENQERETPGPYSYIPLQARIFAQFPSLLPAPTMRKAWLPWLSKQSLSSMPLDQWVILFIYSFLCTGLTEGTTFRTFNTMMTAYVTRHMTWKTFDTRYQENVKTLKR